MSCSAPEGWDQRPARLAASAWYCPLDHERLAGLDAAPEPMEAEAPMAAAQRGEERSGAGGLPCLGAALIGLLALGALFIRRGPF